MPVMSASEALAETLVAYGVDTVFGIIGSAILDPVDLFESAGIRFVGVQHEQAAAHMADGYARASGRPGVCIAQNGPGVTNLITGVAAAYWAHTPLLCITPEASSSAQGLGGFQEVEQLPFFEKITKFQAHVAQPGRLAELVGRCLDYAVVERGPAQVNIPRDMFYSIVDTRIPKPRRVVDPVGAESEMVRAAELLAGATFPVILVGGGVIDADAIEEVAALAELLGAPVVTQDLHNDAFTAGHALMCGPIGYLGSKAAMQILHHADVVLALGTRLGPSARRRSTISTSGPRGPGSSRSTSITEYWASRRKWTSRSGRGKGTLVAHPQAASGVRPLSAPATAAIGATQLVERLLQDWTKELNDLTDRGPDGELSPRRALRELQRHLPADAIVATDVGNVVSTASSYLTFSARAASSGR